MSAWERLAQLHAQMVESNDRWLGIPKPRVTRVGGTWLCRGRGSVAVGSTAELAYVRWKEVHWLRTKEVWQH